MELSFDCLKTFETVPKKDLHQIIQKLQKDSRKCENDLPDLLSNSSVWIYKEGSKNWCFNRADIPALIKSGKNPYTGKNFPQKVIAQLKKEPVKEILSYKHLDTYLPAVYINREKRLNLVQAITNGFVDIHMKLSPKNQCLSSPKKELLQYLTAVRKISAGSFGSVSEGCIGKTCEYRFAIKQVQNADFNGTKESEFLEQLINPLVKKGICPNLPFLLDTFTCESCSFGLLNKSYKGSCVINILELANGTFDEFLKGTPTEQELYSALFQILAALHAVQFYYQIIHYDIKDINILYYNVVPGGYWRYRVHNEDYYIPNCGKLFVLSDFGVSYTVHPNNKFSQKLGTRYAIIMNNKCEQFKLGKNAPEKFIKWDGKNERVLLKQEVKSKQVTNGNYINLFPEQTGYLKIIGINPNPSSSNFYMYSEIVPPLEFRYDVQDVLRTFVGGPRTTQSGNHSSRYKLPMTFRKHISKYVDNTVKGEIRGKAAYFATAGYMIEELFSKWKKPQKEIIDSFDLS